MNKKSLTRKQIVLLAKKYNLMPVLYDFDRMLSAPKLKFTKGGISYLQKECAHPVKQVLEVLRIHKRLKEYAKEIQRNGKG